MEEKIQGIVLAAGLSTRSEKYKLTLGFNDKTIIESCIEGLIGCCFEVIVVGGHNFDIISDILLHYPEVRMVYNPNYFAGMFSSVKEGLKHVYSDKFFIIPGDCPLVKPSTYSKILLSEGEVVIPTFQNRKGHPILIGKKFKEDIMNNPNYNSLRDFVNNHGYLQVEVDDPGVLIDIDTMDDYKNMIDKIMAVK